MPLEGIEWRLERVLSALQLSDAKPAAESPITDVNSEHSRGALPVNRSLVLVHSPLVGPDTWNLVAHSMVGHGNDVSLPDLTDSITAGPPYLARQVQVIVESVEDRPVILVGHSGAGPLLASAGSSLDNVRGYIFVDAGLPTPGNSWMETIPEGLAAHLRDTADAEGWLPPWPEWWSSDELAELLPDPLLRARFVENCPRLPLSMFEEVHSDAPRWRHAPAAYLRLSAAYQSQADEARALGWPVAELESHHLALLTDPDVVVGSLIKLLGQLDE